MSDSHVRTASPSSISVDQRTGRPTVTARLLPFADVAKLSGGGSPPLYERLAQRLRQMVVGGELAPGDPLPNEAELATVFGVSRASVREALRVLSSQRLVETRRGSLGGSFIASPRTGDFTEILTAGIGLLTRTSSMTVDDLLEARELLEVPAAGLAAERRTPQQIDDLVSLHLRGDAGDDRYRHDVELHLALLGASGNPMLGLMAEPVFEVLHLRLRRNRAPAAFWAQVDADHRDILHGVRAGEPDTAASAMRTHLRHLRGTYLEIDRGRV